MMSNIEKLVQQLCPNGVKYVILESVCQITKGIQFNKADMRTGGTYPVINGGITASGYIEQYNQEESTITISQGGASAGYVNWIETKFWAGAHCYVIKPMDKVLNRYLFHFVKSKEYKLQECQYGAGIPALARSTIASLKIPVPPLPVQQEIVRILDHFTALTAELTAELTARRKQYEYYRDELLTFGDEVPRITLGEVGPVCMCKRILKSQTNTVSGVPFYKIGTFGKEANAYISRELYEEYRNKYNFPKKGDILISAAGTIGRTVVYDGKPAYFQDSNIVWIANDESRILNKFLIYCYAMNPWHVSTGGTIARLYNDNIQKAVIPAPTLDQQEYIVTTLEKFDALCNDLSSGLPAEIAARQKQYEYYRDKLLTFKELGA